VIETRRDVLILPYRKAWVGGPDHAQVPKHGRVRRGKGKEPIDSFPSPEEYENISEQRRGRYLYGGPLKIHFGHVLVDSIIRLWAFDPQRHDGVVFAYLKGREQAVPDWFYDIVSIFGLERHHIVIVREPMVFEQLEFAEPGSILKCGPADWYMPHLEKLPLKRVDHTPRNVYYGRTHLIQKGTLMGESYFADLLIGNGFEYVRPEEFDIHHQVSIIQNAERIVFAEGSSIYPIELTAKIRGKIFMIPRRANGVDIFTPHIFPRAEFHVLASRDSIFRMASRSGKKRPNSPTYTLRPIEIHNAMVDLGLVPRRKFDADAFEIAERRDATAYFGGLGNELEKQLAYVKKRRARLRRIPHI